MASLNFLLNSPTAAHCFSGSNFSTPHQQVFVILGHNNLTKISPFEQIRNASEIKLHPNWKKIDGNYDSDIAVLTLSDPVTFTEHVQPNCLPKPTKTTELSDLTVSGTIAGYKKSHESHQASFFDSKVQNITSCLFGDDTACSIYSDEFTCNSVSGGGFYGQKDTSTPYKLYGIFSKGINEDESEFCGLNNFVIFIFVAQYVDWIKSVMNEPFLGQNRRGKELKASTEIFCDYRWNYEQLSIVDVLRGIGGSRTIGRNGGWCLKDCTVPTLIKSLLGFILRQSFINDVQLSSKLIILELSTCLILSY